MTAVATSSSPKPLELSVNEARSRFLQLVRLTRVTHQVTVVLDQDRPVAAIVPPELLTAGSSGSAGSAGPAGSSGSAGAEANAAGWLRRLERVRSDLRRQHAAYAAELTRALDEAWELLDGLRPPGTDRRIDTVRTAHAPLRRRD